MSLAIFTFSLTGCSQSIEHKKIFLLKILLMIKGTLLYTVIQWRIKSRLDIPHESRQDENDCIR